ncbi:MAG: GFA family protein [Pseudomonadota bacterium]
MITGGCLCGAVRFEVDAFVGPFELCHCSRCRKVSGSAFVAAIGVRRSEFRWLSGEELINRYEAPLLEEPPAYRVSFCRVCGSPVPDPLDDGEWFEIAAGLLDDDPELRPDRHIYVEHKAPWHEITDELPQLDKLSLRRLRQDSER